MPGGPRISKGQRERANRKTQTIHKKTNLKILYDKCVQNTKSTKGLCEKLSVISLFYSVGVHKCMVYEIKPVVIGDIQYEGLLIILLC